MGILGNLFRVIVRTGIYLGIIALAITFIPGIPPTHIKYEAFTIKPAMKMEGKLAPNSILNNVKVLEVDRPLIGPESVAIRGDELFFGDQTGKLFKFKNGKVSTLAELGFPCAHLGRKLCSNPLGLRFDPNSGKLVFTDIYGGLLQVDVDTGKVEKLVARHEYVEGAPVGFPEDLDVAKDGTIYWTDGTTTSTIETMWNELIGHSSGRLLKYDPSTNKTTVLLNNIHFANGVQLSENEDFVIVGETVRSLIRRYYLKGSKKGKSDIFIDGLPGYPDNIRSNNEGGFYISMYSPRLPNVSLESSPNVRKFLARTLFLLDYATRTLFNIFPTEFTLTLNKLVVSIAEPKVMEPKNGVIIEVNEKSEIIGSLQSTNGALYGVSQITLGEKYSYFASPSNTKIWYIPTKDLK